MAASDEDHDELMRHEIAGREGYLGCHLEICSRQAAHFETTGRNSADRSSELGALVNLANRD